MFKIFDSHVHTKFSFDCKADYFDVCNSAIEKKLFGISITDHWEIGINREDLFFEEILGSIKTSSYLNNYFSDKLIVSTGIEIGQPHHSNAETRVAMSLYNYDFVLASCHMIRGYGDFCDLKPDVNDVSIILNKYFEEVLEMISTQDFDSLAHLTYPLRYIQGIHKINVNLDEYLDLIDTILKKLITLGKSLEINTYGKRQQINEFSPDFKILERYASLGGELLTLGSDAHRAVDVGSDIPLAIENLLRIGFKEYNYYINRKAIKVPFEIYSNLNK